MTQMKRYFLYSICLIALFSSCKKDEDFGVFDVRKAYLHFGVKNPAVNNPLEKYLDSLEYSFFFESDVTMTQKRYGIPVNVIGEAKPYDRKFNVIIDKDRTTIDTLSLSVEQGIIRAGRIVDTLYVILNKTEELSTSTKRLALKIIPSEEFGVGHGFNQVFKLNVTNNLTGPEWWYRWRSVFGETYYPELYQLWMQIYHEKADPTPELNNSSSGPYFYNWNNMPFAPNATAYPVLYMHLNKLREYLIANPTYPASNPSYRILLP